MPIPPEPALVARSPRPWLTRGPGDCAFPVGGDGKWTLACCNPSGAGTYCRAHAKIMRGPKVTAAAVFERNVMKMLEEG